MNRRLERFTKISKVVLAVPAYALVHKNTRPRYAKWLRKEVEQAGCLAVKLGQWVSSRVDVFPDELTEEFANLRTNVAPIPSQTVTDIVKRELGSASEYVDALDQDPVSTGSIAQVHKAVVDGRELAIKIQRPGIKDELEDDVKILTFLLAPYKWVRPRLYMDLMESIRELVDTVTIELDFPREAQNMETFRAFFEQGCTIPSVVLATQKVIVMDYVDSRPLTDRTKDNEDTGKELARRLMALFFMQFFDLGYIHTDMHSGNLGYDPQNDTIVMYDFGSVLKCPENMSLCVKQLLAAYLNKNVDLMLDYMLEYGLLLPPEITQQDRVMVRQFLESVIVYAEKSDIKEFASSMQQIGSPSGVVQFQRELFMVMRSFTLLEGLCKELDPDFVILDAIEPLTSYFMSDPMMYRLKIEDDLRTAFALFKSIMQQDEQSN